MASSATPTRRKTSTAAKTLTGAEADLSAGASGRPPDVGALQPTAWLHRERTVAMFGLYRAAAQENDPPEDTLSRILLRQVSLKVTRRGIKHSTRHSESSRKMKLETAALVRACAQSQARVAVAPLAGGKSPLVNARYGMLGMDMTWITGRLALGGGIWNPENMAAVARAGITHIIDMQIEFDDTPLARPHGIEVLWNPTDDDFQPKPSELFQRGVEFAEHALRDEDARLFVHCAAGVHRAAMMTLAILCSDGWELQDAMRTIVSRRPVVDFADVYVESVERFLGEQVPD